MTDPSTESSQANELKKDQDTIEQRAKTLDLAVVYRSEAGAFEDKAPEKIEEILTKIQDARRAGAKGEIAHAHFLLTKGFTELHAAVRAKGWWWRWVHIHAVPLYAYYLIFLVGLLFVGLVADINLAIWGVPIVIVVFGTLGGVLRGLWWIYKKVQTRTLRPQFTMVYISGPWLGALLGMFSWVLVKGGLLFLSGTDGADASVGENGVGDISATSEGMNAVAFLAGYSWEWVVGRIKNITDKSG